MYTGFLAINLNFRLWLLVGAFTLIKIIVIKYHY